MRDAVYTAGSGKVYEGKQAVRDVVKTGVASDRLPEFLEVGIGRLFSIRETIGPAPGGDEGIGGVDGHAAIKPAEPGVGGWSAGSGLSGSGKAAEYGG